jgi:maltose O-acetyltransferase
MPAYMTIWRVATPRSKANTLRRLGRLLPHQDLARNLFLRFVMSSFVNVWLRRVLLRKWGAELGETAYIQPGSFFYSPNFEIGEGSFLNYGAWLDSYSRISIGRDVWIGQRTTVLTATHELGGEGRRAGTPTGIPVSIGDGCWIGACVTVCPGVTIGSGCVIAAGAVVAQDCESNGFYAGVPAVRKRDL